MTKFWFEMGFVFFADMLLDVCCVRYNLSVTGRKPWPATMWSISIALNAGLSTIVFVDNYWTLIAGAAGAAIGTYWTVWHAKKEDGKE